MAAVRFHVEGRVQGVFFRASTRDEAVRLALTGYARNLAAGGVEVLAVGQPDAIDQLERWLEHGPPTARVDHVVREDLPDHDRPAGFITA